MHKCLHSGAHGCVVFCNLVLEMRIAGYYFFASLIFTSCNFSAPPDQIAGEDQQEFTIDSAKYHQLYDQRLTINKRIDSLLGDVLGEDQRYVFGYQDSSHTIRSLDSLGIAVYIGQYLAPSDSVSDIRFVLLTEGTDTAVSVMLDTIEVDMQSGFFDIPGEEGVIRRVRAFSLQQQDVWSRIDIQGDLSVIMLRGSQQTVPMRVSEKKAEALVRYRQLVSEREKMNTQINFLRERWMGRLK